MNPNPMNPIQVFINSAVLICLVVFIYGSCVDFIKLTTTVPLLELATESLEKKQKAIINQVDLIESRLCLLENQGYLPRNSKGVGFKGKVSTFCEQRVENLLGKVVDKAAQGVTGKILGGFFGGTPPPIDVTTNVPQEANPENEPNQTITQNPASTSRLSQSFNFTGSDVQSINQIRSDLDDLANRVRQIEVYGYETRGSTSLLEDKYKKMEKALHEQEK